MKTLLPVIPLLLTLVAFMPSQASAQPSLEQEYAFETQHDLYPCHWVCTGDTLRADTNDDGIVGHLISGLWVSCYEIPQELWSFTMGSNPSPLVGDDLPVTAVSRAEVDSFCLRISRTTHRHWRLPSKEEWLFIYHGGLLSEDYRFCGSNRPEWVAWYRGTSGGRLHPVGQRIPNELRIFDMLGNAAEMVTDGDSIRFMGGSCLDPSPRNNPDHLVSHAPPDVQGFRIVCSEPQWIF